MSESIIPYIVDKRAEVAWADGLTVNLPASIVKKLHAGNKEGISLDSANNLRLLKAYTNTQPISSRIPIRYNVLPGWLRSMIASSIGRVKRKSDSWAKFPCWPIDLSADFLSDIIGIHSPFSNKTTHVILTHDLDSAEGLNNLHSKFLEIEEKTGARSTNYIVPFAWPIDHALLEEVASRGNEIGIHGYDHSNRTPFMLQKDRKFRLHSANELIERYKIIGYRAPSLLRTSELLTDLKPLYRYDSSIPTTGGLFPVPNNGCASARPFKINDINEIPVTMPRDGSLRFLGYRPEEIFRLWVDCANRIAESGGVIVLLTHCEDRFSGNKKMISIYERFLNYIAESPRFKWSTPTTVLNEFESKIW